MSDHNAVNWDRYWSHGFLTSCADAFKGNYGGAMRDVWQRFFVSLPPGSRILDICTGNGAIALLAAAAGNEAAQPFSIDAVDLARIQPHKAVSESERPLLDQIRFHPQVDAAATPFGDASFDAIVGHFAIEYTDTAATLQELARLCAEGGRCRFVIHHEQSAILQTAREEQAHVDLLRNSELFARAQAFVELVGGTAPNARDQLQQLPHAEQLRQNLNDSAAMVTTAVRDARHPEILRIALGVVGESYKLLGGPGLDAALQRLQAGKDEIEANALRLADLAAAALDRPGIEALGALFETNQFAPPTVDTLNDDDGRLIGWILDTQKS